MVDFDRLGTLFINCGTCREPVTPIVSSPVSDLVLSGAQRQQIIDKVRQIFEDALPGGYAVSEGSDGTYTAVVSPIGTPLRCPMELAGEAGRSFDPAVVYLNSHVGSDGNLLSGAALINALAETIAHELGHKLGIGHNPGNSNDIMTLLEPTFDSNRRFALDGEYLIEKNFCLKSGQYAMAHDPNAPSFSLVCPDARTTSAAPEGGGAIEALAWVDTPIHRVPQDRFGFINDYGEFVTLGDTSNTPANPARLSLFFEGGIDVALFIPPPRERLFSIGTGTARQAFGTPSPEAKNLYRDVLVSFDTDSDGSYETKVTLRIDSVTGGFSDPCGQNPPGDVDADGDVDLKDFALMQRCFAGDTTSPPLRCDVCYDRDGDGDVDVRDFNRWSHCVGGPGVAADPTCDD